MFSVPMGSTKKSFEFGVIRCITEGSGIARTLLHGGTDAWRTGSEVRGDKVIQK